MMRFWFAQLYLLVGFLGFGGDDVRDTTGIWEDGDVEAMDGGSGIPPIKT